MNETVNAFTTTGGVLLFVAVLVLVISGFIAHWFHDKIFSVTVKNPITRGLAIGGPIAISLTLIVCAFPLGRAGFTATYDVETETLLPGTPSDAVGSPYFTLDGNPDFVSFTSRGKDGVLSAKTARINVVGGLFSSGKPAWSIVDDATTETARTEIATCTYVNDAGGRALMASCDTLRSIHIPRVETVKG